MRKTGFSVIVTVMATQNVRTVPAVSHEKRNNLVDQLWHGIRDIVDGIDRNPQRDELILELEKCTVPRRAVSLRLLSTDDIPSDICLD